MTTESSRGKCKFCGSPYHRGWQCKENPKIKAKSLTLPNKTKQSASVSPRTSKKTIKRRSSNLRSKVIKEYDEVFSKFLRRKAEIEGNLFCFTCGKRLTYETAVVMHFISRRFISTRFDEDNVHVGCRKCNTPDKEQPKVLEHYADLLGQDVVEQLNQKKQQRMSTPELQQSLRDLKDKFSLLIK